MACTCDEDRDREAGLHRSSGTANAFGGYRCICGATTACREDTPTAPDSVNTLPPVRATEPPAKSAQTLRREERRLWTAAALLAIAGLANHAAVIFWHWPPHADWHWALYGTATVCAGHAAYRCGRIHGRRERQQQEDDRG
jgi:hypothetical protein